MSPDEALCMQVVRDLLGRAKELALSSAARCTNPGTMQDFVKVKVAIEVALRKTAGEMTEPVGPEARFVSEDRKIVPFPKR